MRIIAHQHRPMLRRIRVFVDLVRDQFPQPGLLCKPLASQPSHGVPAHLDWARRPACQGLRDGDDIFRRAEPNRVSEGYIAFLVTFLAARGVRRQDVTGRGIKVGQFTYSKSLSLLRFRSWDMSQPLLSSLMTYFV